MISDEFLSISLLLASNSSIGRVCCQTRRYEKGKAGLSTLMAAEEVNWRLAGGSQRRMSHDGNSRRIPLVVSEQLALTDRR